MKLNLDRLEKLRQRGSKIIARCPACAEMERDRTGDPLAIFDSGGFACPLDREHSRRILQLAGNNEFHRDSQAFFSTLVRRQKPMQDAPPPGFAAVTCEARCRGSECRETRACMASWRPGVRHVVLTKGGPNFLAMVDAGIDNLTPAGSTIELQIFTLSHP